MQLHTESSVGGGGPILGPNKIQKQCSPVMNVRFKRRILLYDEGVLPALRDLVAGLDLGTVLSCHEWGD